MACSLETYDVNAIKPQNIEINISQEEIKKGLKLYPYFEGE